VSPRSGCYEILRRAAKFYRHAEFRGGAAVAGWEVLGYHARRGECVCFQENQTVKPTSLLLLVALAWAAVGFAQTASPSPAAQHAWHQSQKPDPGGTYTFTRFTLEGKFLGSPQGANRPALTVDCIPGTESKRGKPKYLTASLLVGTELKVTYVEPEEIRGTSYYPKVAVSYSTDGGGESADQNWSLGTDRTPNAAPADKDAASIPREALKKMLRAHTVAITADDSHGSPIQMQFDMPDSAALEAACHVNE
jgi:hypothetical protein